MLPSQLKYNNKINASYARNFSASIAPMNTSVYGLGDTVIINIPTNANQFLSGADTVLSGTLTMRNAGAATSAATAFTKAGIAGMFRRMRIFHGSTLLQDIDNYGQLCSMLYSFQRSKEDLANKGYLLEGTGGEGVAGRNLGVLGGAQNTTPINFCIPLLSVLSMCENYVPLWAMTGSPLRIELQIVDSIAKFVGCDLPLIVPTGGASLLSGVKLIANIIELSDSAMTIVKKSLNGGPAEWVTQSFANFQSSNVLGDNVDTQLSIPVPAKYHSLKGLFATFRLGTSAAGAANVFADDSSTFGLLNYRVRIGSQILPSEAPSTIPQYLCEVERALGCVSNRHSVSSYTPAQYSSADSGALALSGAFCIALETESYSNLSDMSSTYTGMNTTTSDIFLSPTFHYAGGGAITSDVYALYDQLIVIENGMCTVQV